MNETLLPNETVSRSFQPPLNKKKKNTTNYKVQHELIAGTFAGWAQVFVGHPFDTVKVKLQTQTSPPIYFGPVDCTRRIVSRDGFSGLYRGVTSPLLGVGACNAVIFASNGLFRQAIAKINNRPSSEHLKLSEMTLAGGLAGASVAFINCPVELLKIQLQLQKDGGAFSPASRPSLLNMGRSIITSQGLFGLYRGLFSTILRDVPSFAGYFATYHGLKSLYFSSEAHDSTSSKLPAQFQLLFGGLAGIACWVVCYPQDVLKSRIQGSSIQGGPLKLSEAWTTLRLEGGVNSSLVNQIRPFLRGATPTLARAFPANAATFMLYEAYMNHFAPY